MSKSFSSKYRVYYEDTDAMQVMYHANYLRFFERARTEFMISKQGFSSEIYYVIKHCELEFFKPARFQDMVIVTAEIENVANSSLTLNQKMYNEIDNQLLAELKVLVVAVDAKSFKPTKISAELKEKLQNA